MSKFFTRTGDQGYTGLLGNERVPKYHVRMEAIGTLDETSAILGLARTLCQAEDSKQIIPRVQKDLYHMMAETAATPENAARFRAIDGTCIDWLEEQIQLVGEKVEMPADFVLPGASQAGATMAVARTVVRRAERHIVRLFHEGLLENGSILTYLNRLSSLCFVLELLENSWSGKAQPPLAKG